MHASALNLTRKWRAQTFDTLVGQELVVKILKNSLYISHFFPVYLFSGQRGCGKTSTARIFAAALNCMQLAAFQAKPKEVAVPCGVCESCVAMLRVRHPDFIEIDAASHTGVDNIRSIIDAAYYLPVLGRKKIYLIDEAHMLSKAAFNALLKIFEEPPMHAHFILATTDPEKIIETVRSRCFSLFFDAIESNVLANHLQKLCLQEKIDYTDQALQYIARSAEGSARDAINILETVRFSYPAVTYESVVRVLGHVDDQKIVQILGAVLTGDASSFLQVWSQALMQRASAHHIWSRLIRLIRALIWHKHGVISADVSLSVIEENFSPLLINRSAKLLEALYNLEPLFIRSSNQHALLEFALLQFCAPFKKESNDSSGQSGVTGVSLSEPEVCENEEMPEDVDPDEQEEESDDAAPLAVSAPLSDDERLRIWRSAAAHIPDPLLASVLSQIVTVTRVQESGTLELHFAAQHSFFADMLTTATAVWQPLIEAAYEHKGAIECFFDAPTQIMPPTEKKLAVAQVSRDASKQTIPQKLESKQSVYQGQSSRTSGYVRRTSAVQEKSIDVSDIQRWPLTNRVLSYFPGTVTVVDEARL